MVVKKYKNNYHLSIYAFEESTQHNDANAGLCMIAAAISLSCLIIPPYTYMAYRLQVVLKVKICTYFALY